MKIHPGQELTLHPITGNQDLISITAHLRQEKDHTVTRTRIRLEPGRHILRLAEEQQETVHTIVLPGQEIIHHHQEVTQHHHVAIQHPLEVIQPLQEVIPLLQAVAVVAEELAVVDLVAVVAAAEYVLVVAVLVIIGKINY